MDPNILTFVKSYEVIFSSIMGLSTAVFGACLFVVLRHFGMIDDTKYRGISVNIWLYMAATCSVLAIIFSLFMSGTAWSVVSDTYKAVYVYDLNDKVKEEARPEYDKQVERLTCISSYTDEILKPNDGGHYFDECIRGPFLAPMVSTAMILSGVGLAALLVWFIGQITAMKREDRDDKPIDPDNSSDGTYPGGGSESAK